MTAEQAIYTFAKFALPILSDGVLDITISAKDMYNIITGNQTPTEKQIQDVKMIEFFNDLIGLFGWVSLVQLILTGWLKELSRLIVRK